MKHTKKPVKSLRGCVRFNDRIPFLAGFGAGMVALALVANLTALTAVEAMPYLWGVWILVAFTAFAQTALRSAKT